MAGGIALYGGSFDPIHHGHLIVARAIAEHLDLSEVVFLPTAHPPHKDGNGLASPSHRIRMVEAAIADEPLFAVSNHDLTRPGPTYTIDTVLHFAREREAGGPLCWIVGADSLADLPTWHRVSELVDACRVITAGRTGWTDDAWEKLGQIFSPEQVSRLRAGVVATPIVDVSSSDIRQRIARGASVRYLMPESVRAYIQEHQLYAN